MSLSAASDPPPPSLSKYPVGTVLRKHFPGHGWFKGWIDSSNAYYYRIVYEDGDAEEMDESEVAQYLGQRRRQGRPHKGGSSGVTTTLPPQPNKKARTAVTTTTTTSTSAKTRSGWKRTDLLWTSQGLDPRHFAKQNFTVAALDAATTERLADFFLFMYERQMIWVRRSSGQAPPWTELPPFQDFCFCNVYRELDRGTTFLHAHILDLWEAQQSSGTPSERDWTFAVLWAAYTYRLMNRVSTFQAVGFPSINNVKAFLEQCQNLLDEGQAIFTGVHQTNGWAKYQLWLKQMSAKHAQPMAKVVDDLLQATTVAACQKILQQLPGVSNFMSWQLWCDLRESRCLMGVTSDVTTYCTLGPGAKKGLDLIFGQIAKGNEYLPLACLVVEQGPAILDGLGLSFPKWNGKDLTLKEVEHALCEYQKFISDYRPKCAKREGRPADSVGDKECFQCSATGVDGGKCCDSCWIFYCSSCTAKQCQETSPSWICRRCRAFEQVTFSTS